MDLQLRLRARHVARSEVGPAVRMATAGSPGLAGAARDVGLFVDGIAYQLRFVVAAQASRDARLAGLKGGFGGWCSVARRWPNLESWAPATSRDAYQAERLLLIREPAAEAPPADHETAWAVARAVACSARISRHLLCAHLPGLSPNRRAEHLWSAFAIWPCFGRRMGDLELLAPKACAQAYASDAVVLDFLEKRRAGPHRLAA